MAATFSRLPDVYFEDVPSSPEEVLPRMDIAMFVGFASRGAINTPVAVEDAAQFSSKFGDDVELCWDEQRGQVVYSYLGAAVRAFFRNGGRRCWVVRVPHESDDDTRTQLPFSASVFLDERLCNAASDYELQTLTDLYRSRQVGRAGFKGIHAALDPGQDCDMDEVTIIAVPDAVHLGWEQPELPAPEPPLPSAPINHPEWWHFAGCVPVPEDQLPPGEATRTAPDRGEFQRSDLVVLPEPTSLQATVANNAIYLTWEWTPPDADAWSPTFVLEEARLQDWRDAATIYAGGATSFILRGRQPGDYFYRVRVQARGETSNWSDGIAARVLGARRWLQKSPDELAVQAEVHKALLLLCAARGDCFAMMAVPRHLREQGVRDYCLQLRGSVDERSQSFGAIYHPWLMEHDDARPELVRVTPPDGAMCGVMAARAASRGAWVSPANEQLQNVFALDPHLQVRAAPDLQADSVNAIWQGPRGFLALSAQTLSPDADWRDINVRRLICLLRRVALKHGVRYVFEPNNDAFRRAIQHGFENLMRGMFLRGAFAGSVATEAYRVVVDERVNTPQQMDRGQLIVELRVAPSLPMKFLTVRLLQSHDTTLVQEAV